MKPKIFVIVTVLVLIPLFVFAQNVKSTGIGLRGSYYDMTNGPMEISVINHGQHSKANVGGGGGWLYLYSRVGDNLFLEIHVGAVGEVSEETHNYDESKIDVNAITPILLGLRQELLSPYNQSNLRPYFSFLYWYWKNRIFNFGSSWLGIDFFPDVSNHFLNHFSQKK